MWAIGTGAGIGGIAGVIGGIVGFIGGGGGGIYGGIAGPFGLYGTGSLSLAPNTLKNKAGPAIGP